MKNKTIIITYIIAVMAVFAAFIVVSTCFAAGGKAHQGGPPPSASGAPQKPSVMGKVSSVSGTTIIMSGRQGYGSSSAEVAYTIDASSATIKKIATSTGDSKLSEETISISEIQVGDTLMVQGEINGLSVAAKEIMVGRLAGPPGGPKGAANMSGKDKMATTTSMSKRMGTSTEPDKGLRPAGENNGTSTNQTKTNSFWSKILNPIKNLFSKIFKFL